MQRKHKEQNGTTQTPTTTITSKTKIGPPKYQQQQAHRRLYQVVYEDLKGNHNRNEVLVRSGRRGSENKKMSGAEQRGKEEREKQCASPSNLSDTLGMLFPGERTKVRTLSVYNQKAPPAPVIAAAESGAPANKGRASGGRSQPRSVYKYFLRRWARGWSWV